VAEFDDRPDDALKLGAREVILRMMTGRPPRGTAATELEVPRSILVMAIDVLKWTPNLGPVD